MDRCIEVHEMIAAEDLPPLDEEEFDHHFYARRAFNLSFLLLNLERLRDEVALDSETPINFLDKAALFGKETLQDQP